MLVLQVGKIPMEYPRLGVSSIRQNEIILMYWNSKQLRQVFINTIKTKSLYMLDLCVIM